MKNKNKILLFLMCLLLFPIMTTKTMAYDNSSTITIPDANLKSAVLRQLKKSSTSTITVEHLKSLTTLSANFKGIKSLEGLQYCTNLKLLNLKNNNISNISPLAHLTNLKYLYIDSNEIYDASPLANLNSLSGLSINNQTINLLPVY